MARIFCGMVYDMMKWNRAAKYRCMAVYQEFDDKSILVFNLDECLQVFTEVIEIDDACQRGEVPWCKFHDYQMGAYGYRDIYNGLYHRHDCKKEVLLTKVNSKKQKVRWDLWNRKQAKQTGDRDTRSPLCIRLQECVMYSILRYPSRSNTP